MIAYRGWEISVTLGTSGIPDRSYDWTYSHKDYDGPPDKRCGCAPTLEDAKHAVDQWWEVENDDAA